MSTSASLIALEGGTTLSRAGLYSAQGDLIAEVTAGPANPSELGIDTCVTCVSEIVARFGVSQIHDLVAGISGAARRAVRDEVARQLGLRLRPERVLVTDDLHPVLLANTGTTPALLAIAGTGSSVIAQDWYGRWIIVGGRGRVFGDFGSAYAIAVAALRAVGDAIDGSGSLTALVKALPAALGLEEAAALVPWSLRASKPAIAALAQEVDRVAREGDHVAVLCIKEEALRLAEQVWAAALKIYADDGIKVFMHGGVLDQSRLFRQYFEQTLETSEPHLIPIMPEKRGHACMAALAFLDEPLPEWISHWSLEEQRKGAGMPVTESVASGKSLDSLSSIEIVHRMNEQDQFAAEAVKAAARPIAATIDAAAHAITSGGRVIYIGAGTSGRLGILDASECAPTFGLGQDRVMAIIAGGSRAVRESIEGVEDDARAGWKDINGISPPVGPRDLVIGIAASGRTAYTVAALVEAKHKGARTAFICCSPPVGHPADVVIALATGPEILAGSTRLKAGTATKMVLNMISTGAMALSGYIYKGLMVGMRPVNAKLWDRAMRIVSVLTGRAPGAASTLLRDADGRIPVAVLMALFEVDAAEATKKLRAARGNLREALARK